MPASCLVGSQALAPVCSPQAVPVRSAQVIGVGETYDFELTAEPGKYRLVAELREKPLWTRELVAR